MSYSFNVRAATAAAAAALVATELDKVAISQPIHQADRQEAQEAVEAILDVVGAADNGEELSVSVAGSVAKTDDRVTLASVSVNVAIVPKTE